MSASPITLPLYGVDLSSNSTWTEWDGVTEITASDGDNIAVIETTSQGKALRGGVAVIETE